MRMVCLVIVALVCCSGCATILAGKTQNLTIATNPAGASCELTREGRVVGSVSPTPGAIMVNKTKHDISVVCKKDGYEEATGFLESGTEGATFANIAAGGLIGWGIDSASGADNKYPEVTTITMQPVIAAVVAGATKGNAVKAAAPVSVASAVGAMGKSIVARQGLEDKGTAAERLRRLDDLKASNLISEEDYKKVREKILGEI